VEFFPDEASALAADVRSAISLKRISGPDELRFEGFLTRLDGSPLADRPVEIYAMPDDHIGIPYEYTFSGTVPDEATRATAGFRVNTECNCSGASEFFIYEISYVENGGSNRVQGNRFQSGMDNFFKWGSGQVSVEASDQGDGRMMHVKAAQGQDIGLNSWEFTVTPGASFTYTVKARVVPGSFDTGFFGLFMSAAAPEEGLRVAIPFFDPPIPIAETRTNETGRFEFLWQDAPGGRYEIKAVYSGDGGDWDSTDVIKTIVK
jgi:hypothetical protein